MAEISYCDFVDILAIDKYLLYYLFYLVCVKQVPSFKKIILFPISKKRLFQSVNDQISAVWALINFFKD